MAALFANRRKATVGYLDEEKEANKRKQLEVLEIETRSFFFPMLEKKFDQVKEKFPNQNEIVVNVRACNNGRFEFTTVPEIEKEIQVNHCKSGNREILYMAIRMANDRNIKAFPYQPDWNGWIFPFSKTYP